MKELKKIIIIGSSFFNSCYFNMRILGDTSSPDEVNFANTLEKIYNVPVTSYAINGAGNQWPVNATISHLDEIDENTMVIVMWSGADRFDMHICDDTPQESMELPPQERLPPQIRHETCMTTTFGLDGIPSETGLRFYSTGADYIGKKKLYKANYYSFAIHLKQTYEHIALVQNLLSTRCLEQKHILAFDIEGYADTDIVGSRGDWVKQYPDGDYTCDIVFPEKKPAALDLYPELHKWRNLIDWNLFTKTNYIDFFHQNKLPFWAGNNSHNIHQVPWNNYRFITSEIKNDFGEYAEFYKSATDRHCEKYNIGYPKPYV